MFVFYDWGEAAVQYRMAMLTSTTPDLYIFNFSPLHSGLCPLLAVAALLRDLPHGLFPK